MQLAEADEVRGAQILEGAELVPQAEQVFAGARTIDGICNVSPVQLYRDVLGAYRDQLVVVGGWVPELVLGGSEPRPLAVGPVDLAVP